MSLADDIQTVSAQFAKLDSIDPDGPLYQRLVGLLDRCDDDAIVAVYDARIKFVSALALNRMIRRGLVPAVEHRCKAMARD